MNNIDQILATEKARQPRPEQTELDQIDLQRVAAELALLDAESGLRSSKRRLAAMLNISPEQCPTLELRATVHDRSPAPPPVSELSALALAARPDLASFRLGISRAQADVDLAKANRFSDVYMLYQPFTYQNNPAVPLPFVPIAGRWVRRWRSPSGTRNQGALSAARRPMSSRRASKRRRSSASSSPRSKTPTRNTC